MDDKKIGVAYWGLQGGWTVKTIHISKLPAHQAMMSPRLLTFRPTRPLWVAAEILHKWMRRQGINPAEVAGR